LSPLEVPFISHRFASFSLVLQRAKMPVSVPPQSDDALSLGVPSGVKVLPSASLSHLFFLRARSLSPSQRNRERLPYYKEETSRSCFFSVLHLADIGAHKPFSVRFFLVQREQCPLKERMKTTYRKKYCTFATWNLSSPQSIVSTKSRVNLPLLRFSQGIGRHNAQIHIGMRIHLAAPEAAQRQQRQLPCRLHLTPQRGNGVREQGAVGGKKTLRAAVAAVVGNDLPFVLGQLLRQKLRGLRHGGIPWMG